MGLARKVFAWLNADATVPRASVIGIYVATALAVLSIIIRFA